MTLNEFCKDSWIKTEDGYYVSKHCYENEIALYSAIARWQDKKLSPSENETLVKCLICGVFANRRIWREVKEKLLRFCRTRYDWEDGLSECFQILVERNLFYLLSFDLKKVECRDNENVMKLLSCYINNCLYFQIIFKKYILTEYIIEELPTGINESLLLTDGDKILSYIFSLFEKAHRKITIYAFIHESLSARKRKSDLARQHKKRLIEYIGEYLIKEEHHILKPFHAGMITDYIEESLREDEDHPILIRLRNEHETLVQRIRAIFEQAWKVLKLDNFISESKACVDKRFRSSICTYETEELIKFIRQRLNDITENINYFQYVTPQYIADEIGRMICEKKIDCLNRDFQD